MSLDKLTSLQSPGSQTSGPQTHGRPKRVPSWLLPVGLALGFLAVFALLFGSRLLPAFKVQTAPVVTLRQTTEASAPIPSTNETTSSPALPTGPLLFQASGWIEPDPYTTFVPTLIDGVINEVHVLEGQPVTKEQLLATLIDDDAKLDLQQAKQRVASLESKRTAHCAAIPVLEAEQEAARKKVAAEEALLAELQDSARRLSSVSSRAVSEMALTQAKLQVTRQEAAVAEAEAAIPGLDAQIAQIEDQRVAIDNEIHEAETERDRRQLALDRTTITAPMDGIVLRLHAAPGKKRMLGMDDPESAVIVELYDPQKLQARIDVPLNEAAALAVGQPVKFTTDLLPDLSLTGTVSRITGEADLQRNTLQVKVAVHNPDPRLRPEMLVRAEFYNGGTSSASIPNSDFRTPHSQNRLALYAPKAALFDRSGKSAKAWLAINGHAELRSVNLGVEERDDHLLVLEGLHSGDQLILPPHAKLSEGKRITSTSQP